MKKIYSYKPCIIFFTGLSASGKSTLCLTLKNKLKNFGITKVINLDGDVIRKKFNNFNYKKKFRNKVGDKKIKIALKYKKNNFITLVSGIAHNKRWRKNIKDSNKDYFEIFVKCPIKICEKRDYKNQYSKARNGIIKNFVGIHDHYQIGDSHDLTIDTSRLTVRKSVIKLFNFLIKKKYVF